jgi:cation transport ATPase
VYLETLGKIQTLCFDKTGTLTVGVFQLTELVSITGSTRDEALKLLLSIELESTHPMASAICHVAREEGATPYEMVEDFENLPGEGVSATVGTVMEPARHQRVGAVCTFTNTSEISLAQA